MKKFFLLLLILVGVCFLFGFKEEKEIRIRVIGNSDSIIDQNYKKQVVSFLKSEVLGNAELSDEYLLENYKTIEAILNSEFDDIEVKYEKHTFKNKTYNDSAIKDGEYKTLLVYIGEAKGSNWWGSIFDGKLNYESDNEVTYEWYFKKNRGES